MNFEEAEIERGDSPIGKGKGKVLGVIVLTDNRQGRSHEKPSVPDYRCSGFKGKRKYRQRLKWTLSSLPSTKTPAASRTSSSPSWHGG